MFGLLNVRKPSGCTSRDVVNRVQRLVQRVKVGHAGTLDPLATGVLVLGLGPATRLVPFIQELRKAYSATFMLGRRSDTDDIEGEIVECHPEVRPARHEIELALPQFIGEISQRPPDYSAIKVKGQRAYAMARRGEAVDLAARPVTVYDIQIRAYQFPELQLDIECGSGTYVRSIGRDLAIALGTSAVMSALARTAIGPFRIEDSTSIEVLTNESLERHLLSPLMALTQLPKVQLTPDQSERLAHGQFLFLPRHAFEGFAAAIDSTGRLVAIVRPQNEDHLRPEIVFQRG